jgi:hypothetical protein
VSVENFASPISLSTTVRPFFQPAHQTVSSKGEGVLLPPTLLDVIVHAHDELVAALGAAALQNLAAISSGHAGAKAVHAHAAAGFGLVGTLG